MARSSYCPVALPVFSSAYSRGVPIGWLRDVERLNGDLLGEVMDSREFLFRAERNALAAVRPVPMDLRHGNCFYCGASVKRGRGQVDHLHSLTEYPIDLGHNFVV